MFLINTVIDSALIQNVFVYSIDVQ